MRGHLYTKIGEGVDEEAGHLLLNERARRMAISTDGDCFFRSLSYLITTRANIPGLFHSHMNSIGITETSQETDLIRHLRSLVVAEWLDHPERYRPLLSTH